MCSRIVRKGIQCEGQCGGWFHLKCSDLSNEKFEEFSVGEYKDKQWCCKDCVLGVGNSEKVVRGLRDRKEAKNEVVSRVGEVFKVKSVFTEAELVEVIQQCYKKIREEWDIKDTNSTSTVKAIKKEVAKNLKLKDNKGCFVNTAGVERNCEDVGNCDLFYI